MARDELTAALRNAPNINHARLSPVGATEVVMPEAVAKAAANTIDALVDVLVDLHAYHDVPGKKDPVLRRLFSEGAAALRTMDIPFKELSE